MRPTNAFLESLLLAAIVPPMLCSLRPTTLNPPRVSVIISSTDLMSQDSGIPEPTRSGI